MRYDAFISYRHAPLDMEVAKKLHTGLETYKIPKSVQNRTGKKKMGRVFRDQEELPIGSDLDNNITAALADSKYLIVICSPRTPESYWVCKEIETFIQMHDRNHVLAVLIEGEPEESFPAQLLTDEEGNPVEPLAADVRGVDKKERNAKYKTELLRLAAPIIGCTYDELRQRHRERVIRKTVTLASAVAGVVAVSGISFGIYNANVATKMKQLADEKTQMADELAVQYRGKQENQSRFYAQEAISLFEEGNREDAVLVAMEGLPSEDNDRPFVPEAEYALSQALYTYDSGLRMSYERNLHHTLPVDKMKRTDDFTKIVSIDSGGTVYVWNVEDWSLMTTVEPAVDENYSYENVQFADADSSGVYVATDYVFSKYNYEGKLLYSYKYDKVIKAAEVCEKAKKVVLSFSNEVLIQDADSADIISSTLLDGEPLVGIEGKYLYDEKIYIAGGMHDGSKGSFYLVDLNSDNVKEVTLSESLVLEFCKTESGNYAVLCCNGDSLANGVNHITLELIGKEGEHIWTTDLDTPDINPLTFTSAIGANNYNDGETTRKEIIFAADSKAYTVDETSGDIRTTIDLSGNATVIVPSLNAPYTRIGYKNGGVDFINYETGKIESEYSMETNASIKEAVSLGYAFVFDSYVSSDIHVMTFHQAADAEDFMAMDDSMAVQAISDDSEYFAMTPAVSTSSVFFYDKDGTEVYSIENLDFARDISFAGHKVYFQDGDGIYEVDLDEKKSEYLKLEDYGFDGYYSDMSISVDGRIALMWGVSDCLVFDLQKRERLGVVSGENDIGYAIAAPGGKTVYISAAGENLCAVDTESRELTSFKDDNLRSVADSYYNKFMDLSLDGKYLAMCCLDGKIRVVDTDSMETSAEIEVNSYANKFIHFTKDGRYIVFQGNDYKVHVCDAKSGEIVSTEYCTGSIDEIVCDEDSNLMAVIASGSMLMYETENYGCIADISKGIAYLEGDNSILISSDGIDVKRVHYKNYKELIELARKQFGDATLSKEKKVKYNIN